VCFVLCGVCYALCVVRYVLWVVCCCLLTFSWKLLFAFSVLAELFLYEPEMQTRLAESRLDVSEVFQDGSHNGNRESM
jgi:hypothetical protein